PGGGGRLLSWLRNARTAGTQLVEERRRRVSKPAPPSAPRRRHRFADDEPRGQQHLLWGRPGQRLLRHAKRFTPEQVPVLRDGRERRREVGRLLDVVEAHDRDVVRDLQPRLAEGAVGTERHLIVGREDRRRILLGG